MSYRQTGLVSKAWLEVHKLSLLRSFQARGEEVPIEDEWKLVRRHKAPPTPAMAA